MTEAIEPQAGHYKSQFVEETMALSAALLPEFDQEMASTRKTLERCLTTSLTGNPTRNR